LLVDPEAGDPERREVVMLKRFCVFVVIACVASAGGCRPAPNAQAAASRVELRIQQGHSRGVDSVALSPDGRSVLTGSDDDTARLWDMATGREIRRFEGHSGLVYSVAFSPDGRSVLTGSEDKTARLWDVPAESIWHSSAAQLHVATGREIRRFEGHSEQVRSVAFSPDGRAVLTGSRDQTARISEVTTGGGIGRFEGHSGHVSSVAFSPGGRSVLTGSRDGKARLWDMATGRQIRLFEGHTAWVSSVAFSPDGRAVLTGS